jgi:hypothetical protein
MSWAPNKSNPQLHGMMPRSCRVSHFAQDSKPGSKDGKAQGGKHGRPEPENDGSQKADKGDSWLLNRLCAPCMHGRAGSTPHPSCLLQRRSRSRGRRERREAVAAGSGGPSRLGCLQWPGASGGCVCSSLPPFLQHLRASRCMQDDQHACAPVQCSDGTAAQLHKTDKLHASLCRTRSS